MKYQVLGSGHDLPVFLQLNSPIDFAVEVLIEGGEQSINSTIAVKCYRSTTDDSNLNCLINWIRMKTLPDGTNRRKEINSSFPVYQCSPLGKLLGSNK